MRMIICLYRLAYLVKLYIFCARVPTYSAKWYMVFYMLKLKKWFF